MNTIFPNNWPSAAAIENGETELKVECSTFLVPYSVSIKQEYRDFKESESVGPAGPNVKKLLNAINERGFSQMNLICTPLRSQLTVEHMSTLLFISVTGPPLEDCNPLPYVKSWLVQGRHAATNLGKARTNKSEVVTEGRKAIWKCL